MTEPYRETHGQLALRVPVRGLRAWLARAGLWLLRRAGAEQAWEPRGLPAPTPALPAPDTAVGQWLAHATLSADPDDPDLICCEVWEEHETAHTVREEDEFDLREDALGKAAKQLASQLERFDHVDVAEDEGRKVYLRDADRELVALLPTHAAALLHELESYLAMKNAAGDG